jgi:hypothetical protein
MGRRVGRTVYTPVQAPTLTFLTVMPRIPSPVPQDALQAAQNAPGKATDGEVGPSGVRGCAGPLKVPGSLT